MSAPQRRDRANTPVIERARAVLGVRFRLHGRDPAHGLDCVGLVAWAIRADEVPSDYPLRGGAAERIMVLIGAHARPVDEAAPGDVLLMRVGAGQLHLAILSDGGVIHADAGLGRVVERPGPPPWPVLGRWRVEERT